MKRRGVLVGWGKTVANLAFMSMFGGCAGRYSLDADFGKTPGLDAEKLS